MLDERMMKKEDKLFFLGLVTFVLSLFLIPFGLYLAPAALLGFEYTIPDFIVNLVLWVQVSFHATYIWSFFWVVRMFVWPGIFFAAVTYFISRYLNKLKFEEQEGVNEREVPSARSVAERQEKTKDTVALVFKVIGAGMLVVVLINIVLMIMTA